MVTVRDALIDLQDRFRAAKLDTPELDARLLVQAAFGMKHEDLILEAALSVAPEEIEKLDKMAERRLKHEPVSRILGKRAFWKADFKVTPATLDPRADSETLVEAVLKYADKNAPLKILDLGTGTGCLLLSVLQDLPRATGTGVDISAEAIDVAKQNAESLHLGNRVNFMSIDWNKMSSMPFDIVISNPPYIAQDVIISLAPEVREYDPLTALTDGADGLDCYRDIVRLLPRLLEPEGLVFFEIGATQAEAVKGIAGKESLHVLQTLTDLAGHDRCLVARYKPRLEI